ncbi:MAG: porin [Gammaproteobacteria bacterium]|nr:porin [Gammaproteobacteria bacterium]
MSINQVIKPCGSLLYILLASIITTDALAESGNHEDDVAEQEIQQSEAEARETGADEDPLEKQEVQVSQEAAADLPQPRVLNLYGSARLRYRVTEDDSFWADGGSRFGLSARKEVKPELWFFARGEAGINLLESADFLFNRNTTAPGGKLGDNIFARLLYVGFETPAYMVTAGKNWSTYYRVTSFTDRFQGAGASASGTFNVATDGGYTGTGRADNVLQTRIQLTPFSEETAFKPVKLNLQAQHGRPIPAIDDAHYGTTLGASALFQTEQNFDIGLAYNHASIDTADLDRLRSSGIDGDATALALGLRWFSDNWYLGTVMTRLENHEATDDLIYFDGTGLELYAQYRLHKQWWITGGGNYLKPDNNQTQAGDFLVNYGLMGIRYSFREFEQMLFANIRFDYGRTADGRERGDVYTVGIRWDLP